MVNLAKSVGYDFSKAKKEDLVLLCMIEQQRFNKESHELMVEKLEDLSNTICSVNNGLNKNINRVLKKVEKI